MPEEMTDQEREAHVAFTLGMLTASMTKEGFEFIEANPADGWMKFRGSGGLMLRLDIAEVKG